MISNYLYLALNCLLLGCAFKIFYFIYLAVAGLGCSKQDFHCGEWSWLPHGMWDLSPRTGINLVFPALQDGLNHCFTRRVPWVVSFKYREWILWLQQNQYISNYTFYANPGDTTRYIVSIDFIIYYLKGFLCLERNTCYYLSSFHAQFINLLDFIKQ